MLVLLERVFKEFLMLYFLQKKGFDVTIFDRDEPGSPVASYGNAGHFSPYASLSLNRTDMLG